ncbi:HdaA/DnaA family protein [Oricola sp.]|uniref:HdaA/DnaA family protein n=1 Tax=Oricola sp. TaxID=1979950 RepID=UPI003BAB16A5
MREPENQFLLDIGLPASMTRDDLIVSRANREAAALIESWPDWPSSAAVLAGPPGSGKTHLASIWAQRSGARSCDPTTLSGADLDAAQAATPLVIDGLQPGGFDEDALFHLLNAARANGGSILMTSVQWPAAWQVRTPDLRSRLLAAPTVEIGEPDDELLVGVMTKLFSDRQISVDAAVVQFIASRIERSLESARLIVDRLDKAALARKSKITRPFASAYIKEYDENQDEFDF